VDPAIFIPVGQDRRIFEARIFPDGSKVTGPIAVTRSVAVQDRQPMWSPDGKSIVFKRGRTEGNLDLVVRSMETSQERTYPITIGRMGNERPHWFHDGKSISVGVAGQDAYRFDVASGRLQKFDGFGLGPHDISLDGKTIYSLGRNSMDQMSVAGFDIATGQRKETLVQGFLNRSPNAASPGGMAGILRVSPDGRLLATTTRDGGEWQVSIVALDGSSHRDIYKSSRIGMPNGGYTRLLAWTKDSRAILFGQFADGSRTDVQIMRIPVTGGKPQFTGLTLKGITQEDTIDISPDGSRILFSASAEGVSISKPR
jgi:Tol biopolymer transport system component